VHEAAPLVLKEWSEFYVIAGSAAAALTGLMFVVITLVAGDRSRTTITGTETFSTPTVVHFCAALLMSLVLSAPWRSLVHLSAILAVVGAFGVAYGLLLVYRIGYRLQHEVYKPGLDDWLWYAILPLIAYAGLLGAALWLRAGATEAFVALAACSGLLIFIGIHNAWDVVTFIAAGRMSLPNEGSGERPDPVGEQPPRPEPVPAAPPLKDVSGGEPPPAA
jgi:hypothetical protein